MLYPTPLLQELRTDHAGETGAVMIYRGVLAVARDPALREFAQHHLETERRHLELVEQVMPHGWQSRLLPLWRLSGWLTGALPALFGPRAVYATIEAVETFVDRHYAMQVEMIDALLLEALEPQRRAALLSLRALLEQCRLDEVVHRDDAALRRADAAPGRSTLAPMRAWCWLVGSGSSAAVRLCRHL